MFDLYCSDLISLMDSDGETKSMWRWHKGRDFSSERCTDDSFPWYICFRGSEPRRQPLQPLVLIPWVYLFAFVSVYLTWGLLRGLLWNLFLQHRDRYWKVSLKLTVPSIFTLILWLFLAPFIIVIVRCITFAITHTFGRGFWLFPRLLEDIPFFDAFTPVYSWDSHPKETLSLRWRRFRNTMKSELGLNPRNRRTKNKKRHVTPRHVRSQIRTVQV